jgi:hypothetical protein
MLWSVGNLGMAKHKFMVAVDEDNVTVGAQCIRFGLIAMYVDGKVPDDIREQDCKKEDASQAAARLYARLRRDVSRSPCSAEALCRV